jgi:hypothetical protein
MLQDFHMRTRKDSRNHIVLDVWSMLALRPDAVESQATLPQWRKLFVNAYILLLLLRAEHAWFVQPFKHQRP